MNPNLDYSLDAKMPQPPKTTEPKLRHQPPVGWFHASIASIWRRRTIFITIVAAASILLHLLLRYGLYQGHAVSQASLLATFVIGGIPLVYELLAKLWKREFGSDLLAGISIVTSLLLNQYLASAIVVLMLAGGESLENYALRAALPQK